MINTTWMTREVEYLESTGNQWIDTEVYLRTPLRIEWEYYYPNRSVGASIWGSYRQSTINCHTGNSNSSLTREVSVTYNGTMIKIVNGSVTPLFPYRSTATFEAQEGSQTFTTEFGGASASVASSLGDTLTAKCYLFAQGRPNDASPPSSIAMAGARIYSWKCWVGGKLVFDGVPYRVGQTGYMYDRVTRKLFGNKGTGSFVLGPDVARPVIGLWGMRKAIFNTKDYIQSGLVAMYDGIENAGVDRHDNNATVWKDLTNNGYDGELTSLVSWNSDSLLITKDCIPCVVPNDIGNVLHTKIFTIEVVNLGSNRNRRGTIFGNYNADGGNGFNIEWRYGNGTIYTYRAYFNGSPDISTTKQYAANTKQSITLTLRENDLKMYYDAGIFYSRSTQTIRAPGITKYCLGGEMGRGNMAARGNLYCVRIYNRDLTADEIAHNYTIDKVRFNLP